MDPICAECGYDYRTLVTHEAPAVLRREAAGLAETIRVRQPIEVVPEGSWSALEYAGHLRDVLLVARERTLHARRESGAAVVTMAPDERVAWGEYDDLTPTQAAAQIVQAAEWLAHTWQRFDADGWNRTLLYNYPQEELRSLSWLAAHILHEVVHHRLDIERLTVVG